MDMKTGLARNALLKRSCDSRKPRVASATRRSRFGIELAQRSFGALAFDELPDLPADAREHFENIGMRLANLPAKKFNHSEDVFAEPNGKGEGPVQSGAGG
jgi:hypothetical protein